MGPLSFLLADCTPASTEADKDALPQVNTPITGT